MLGTPTPGVFCKSGK